MTYMYVHVTMNDGELVISFRRNITHIDGIPKIIYFV